MDWSKLPSLAALRAFEAAARHQSFSKAAAELNVTHAAISQHVRKLEAEFAETLIERQGRGVVATASGHALAQSLHAGFSTIADGVAQLHAASNLRPLNISTTPAFATNWLMPRIGAFWAKHPEVSVTINPSTDLIDIRRDGFDLAIRYGSGDWPDYNVELLTEGEFWVAAPPALLKGRRATCLQDVTDLPWLLESQMLERRALFQMENIEFEALDLTLLHTNGLVLSAALAGLGVIVQPKSIIEREVAAGTLVKVCELRQIGLGYYLVTLPNRAPKGLRTFTKWLKSAAK